MIVKVKNMNVLIDKADMQLFNTYSWHISDTGYVVWRGIKVGHKRTIRLHRLVAGAKEDEIVDHINRNKLDNRRGNLRIVNQSVNVRNSERYEKAKHYYFDKRKKRWAIDSRSLGVRSLYMDSEKACKDYVLALVKGKKPKRIFTERPRLGGRKITDKEIEYIFNQFNNGKTKRKIARELGYSESAIGRIINGKTTMGKP